jgi:hypothetical protein
MIPQIFDLDVVTTIKLHKFKVQLVLSLKVGVEIISNLIQGECNCFEKYLESHPPYYIFILYSFIIPKLLCFPALTGKKDSRILKITQEPSEFVP